MPTRKLQSRSNTVRFFIEAIIKILEIGSPAALEVVPDHHGGAVFRANAQAHGGDAGVSCPHLSFC